MPKEDTVRMNEIKRCPKCQHRLKIIKIGNDEYYGCSKCGFIHKIWKPINCNIEEALTC